MTSTDIVAYLALVIAFVAFVRTVSLSRMLWYAPRVIINSIPRPSDPPPVTQNRPREFKI